MTQRKSRKYSAGPIGKIKIVRDFLPPPDQLVLKEKSVKVTLLLSQESVDFFKETANKQHVAYQKIIRALLDQYTALYK